MNNQELSYIYNLGKQLIYNDKLQKIINYRRS